MKETISITALRVKTTRGEELELTLDEAKKLHQQLDELFGTNPSQPIIIERDRYPYYDPYSPPYGPPLPWITWCGTSDGGCSARLNLT
jgi:hypothetical protein